MLGMPHGHFVQTSRVTSRRVIKMATQQSFRILYTVVIQCLLEKPGKMAENRSGIRYGVIGEDQSTSSTTSHTDTSMKDASMVQQGISKGNINISDQNAEVMDLSENTLKAQEEHAELLRRYEADRKAAQVYVPTNPEEVIDELRRHGEPKTLFGEKAEDRRERLRKVLATIAAEQGIDAVNKPIGKAAEDARKAAEVTQAAKPSAAMRDKTVHTPAKEPLITARKFIADYSFERAKKRLEAQRQRAEDPSSKQQADKEALSLYSYLRHLNVNMSQIGDERTQTVCKVASDGRSVVSGSWSSNLKLWDAKSAECACTFTGHTNRVHWAAFRPDCTTPDYVANLSKNEQNDVSMNVNDDNSSGRADIVSASADGTAKLWSIDSGKCLNTLSGHSERLSRVEWHPSGTYVGTTSFDCTWRFWDVETGKQILLQDGHAHGVYPIAFHPDGSLVATGDLGGAGRLWDLRSGRSILELRGHVTQMMCLDFSPNGVHLATGSEDHTVRVWDLRQRKIIYTIPAHNHLVSHLRFSPVSGEYLTTSSFDGTIRMWSGRDWSPMGKVSGHDNKITSFDIFPDERHMVSCSFDRTIKWWAHENEF